MRIGLVLSGGGTKGLFHAGALQALHELNVPIHLIAGASAGAMIGAMYAGGHAPLDILDIFKKESFFAPSHVALLKPGILDPAKLRSLYAKYLPATFEELTIPLHVTATNVLKGRSEIFSKGPLVLPVLGSSAFPLVIAPVEINGELYADGGIMNHFPIEPAQDLADKVVGIYLSPVQTISRKDYDSMLAVAERTFRLGRHASSQHKLSACDVLINPSDLTEFSTFSLTDGKMEALFDLGYKEMMAKRDDIRQLSA